MQSYLLRLIAFGALTCGLSGLPSVVGAQETPVVACASDLQFALEVIGKNFQRDTGRSVRLTFGSSGNFARQIEQGAPFSLFLSADESFVFGLADKGLTRDRGELYAIGRIVLFAKKGSALTGKLSPQGLKAALDQGSIKRFAIANPEHAPYGRAAQQWLEKHDLWSALKPTLVLGENASQAAQFATTGDSEAGIMPYSIALGSTVKEAGTFQLLSADDHQPLRQRMVLLKNHTNGAVRFYDYMQSKPAREVMRKYGFVLPSES